MWSAPRLFARQLRGNTPLQQYRGCVFHVAWSVPRKYKRVEFRSCRLTRVEAGSNTSTVTLRVVGGDEKGSLKSETVKYGQESQEPRTRERLRCRGPAAYTKERPVPSSERAPQMGLETKTYWLADRQSQCDFNFELVGCRSTEESKEYKEYDNKNWRSTTELSVGDSPGKLVAEEELEVGLWKLSVWLEDLVTVRPF
jgi:hypothetical protein